MKRVSEDFVCIYNLTSMITTNKPICKKKMIS